MMLRRVGHGRVSIDVGSGSIGLGSWCHFEMQLGTSLRDWRLEDAFNIARVQMFRGSQCFQERTGGLTGC